MKIMSEGLQEVKHALKEYYHPDDIMETIKRESPSKTELYELISALLYAAREYSTDLYIDAAEILTEGYDN